LLAFTSSIELGVVFALVLDCLLNFVLPSTITILSAVPLRRVTSAVSLLMVRTFPLTRPVLAFCVSAAVAENVNATVSTIPNPVGFENIRIDFSFQSGSDHLVEARVMRGPRLRALVRHRIRRNRLGLSRSKQSRRRSALISVNELNPLSWVWKV
jgi:hypothetical protein